MIVPVEKPSVKHAYHLYVIRSKNRDYLHKKLLENDIQAQIHYPIPVHKQKAYSDLSADFSLETTDQVCTEILSLPLHPWMEHEEIIKVTDCLRDNSEKWDH